MSWMQSHALPTASAWLCGGTVHARSDRTVGLVLRNMAVSPSAQEVRMLTSTAWNFMTASNGS
jgi:hypothetical protein